MIVVLVLPLRTSSANLRLQQRERKVNILDGLKVDCYDFTGLRRLNQENDQNEPDLHGIGYGETDAVDHGGSFIFQDTSTHNERAPITSYNVALDISKRSQMVYTCNTTISLCKLMFHFRLRPG